MNFKRIIKTLHLWFGLLSGLLIVFLGITGCILAFQKEIETAVQDYRYVEPKQHSFLPPSRLKEIGAAQLPGKHIHAVLYQEKKHAAQVIFFAFEPVSYYYIVFLDPYTGAVLKVKDMDRDFFRQVLNGHFYLWLPPEIGQPIVATGTLVFLFMLVSGIILWWPRNRAAARQRFSVKFDARWRRVNYDLHNVLGFYISWIAIIIAVTGLVWGFTWFARGLHKAAGGTKELVYTEPVSDLGNLSGMEQRLGVKAVPAIDRVWEIMKAEYPNAEVLEVHPPETPQSPIAANANPDAATYWKTDYRYYDQYSLRELEEEHVYGKLSDAGAADKLIRMNYDIHTGGIIGLPGKILMFFASLVAASLPITGFYIWWGRRKKK